MYKLLLFMWKIQVSIVWLWLYNVYQTWEWHYLNLFQWSYIKYQAIPWVGFNLFGLALLGSFFSIRAKTLMIYDDFHRSSITHNSFFSWKNVTFDTISHRQTVQWISSTQLSIACTNCIKSMPYMNWETLVV